MTNTAPSDTSSPSRHPDRRLGDLRIGPIALGTAGWSFADDRDDDRSLATAAAAVDAGVSLFDTALVYTSADEPARSDRLVGEAVRRAGSDAGIVVSAKGGHYRAPGERFPYDARPDELRRHLDITLRALGAERVDLYSLHHVDAQVPIEESVGALHELREEGKIGFVGVSNVSLEQLGRARSATRIDAVQNRLSPFDRASLDVLADVERTGGLFLAYSPTRTLDDGPIEHALAGFAPIAEAHGTGIRQVVLAWLLSLSPVLVPVVGSTRPATITASATARDLVLTASELDRIGEQLHRIEEVA